MPEGTNEPRKDSKPRPEEKHALGSMIKPPPVLNEPKPEKVKPEEPDEDSEKKDAKQTDGKGKDGGKDSEDAPEKKGSKSKKLTGQHEERVTHTVTFDLTEEEFAFKGKEAARLQGEINGLDREFQQVKEEHKSKTSLLEMECGSLLAVIRRGKEEREVTVTKVIDFDKGLVDFLYQNKIVETRGIKPEERQGKFF